MIKCKLAPIQDTINTNFRLFDVTPENEEDIFAIHIDDDDAQFYCGKMVFAAKNKIEALRKFKYEKYLGNVSIVEKI